MARRSRIKMYPDTKTFHYYNANPKNRITGDCTFRAICTALEKDWKDTVMEMAEFSCQTGYAINDDKGIMKYLEKNGWIKMKQPKKVNGTKYTGSEFCQYLNDHFPNGKGISNIVANIGCHHIVCIRFTDGEFKVNDIWDSSHNCIGNYWIKKKGN